MRVIISTVVILALWEVGCSRAPTTVAPEFAPYYAKYALDVASFAPPPIGFSDEWLDPIFDEAGLCMQDGAESYIMIKHATWDKLGSDNREMLIYRELSRCLFNLRTDNTFDGLCPASIMTSFLFGDTPCYKDNAEYYYQKLREAVK